MKESDFQKKVIAEIESRWPDCFVLKTDSSYMQGCPDLLILYKDKWAALEVKLNAKSKKRPNQNYYVDTMNNLGFASFIYPENFETVFDKLDDYFRE